MSAKTRVLIADDSPFVCRLLASFLHTAGDFEIAGEAHDGREALQNVLALRPDVVTLDLDMPEMDGLEALSRIMRECPTPVVAISGVSGRAATRTLQALDLGAVDFVLKYSPGASIRPDDLSREILAKVRMASRIRVVRRVGGRKPPAGKAAARPHQKSAPAAPQPARALVVIGASTGGPLAVRELLSAFPASLAAATVVVQHIPLAFSAVLATQLDRHSRLAVREADDGDALAGGTVLVAPAGYHLLLRPAWRVSVHSAVTAAGYCPSIDAAMESAARVYGSLAIGVLLTGMGDDGAAGLAAIHDRGGLTFAQDAQSCVVNGMPQRARDRGAVDRSAPPLTIARLVAEEIERRASRAA